MQKEIEQIKKLFEVLKEGHKHYKNATPDFAKRIERALKPTIDQLELLGVDRTYSEALLIFGFQFIHRNEILNRQIELAKKHKARVWQPLVTKGEKASIRVLT